MPRHRKKRNRDLPVNLYETGNGFYRYLHPDTKRWLGMGSNRQQAIIDAHKLNAALLPASDRVAKILKPRKTFGQFLDTWQQDIMPAMDLADETIKDYKRKLPHIRKVLSRIPVDSVTVKDCADFLDQYPNKQSNNYRALLSVIFKHAIAKGLCSKNPADDTLKKKVKRMRDRLSLEAFNAIHAHSPFWLQNAMDLALLTLQRRHEIAAMRWADIKDGVIWIQQQKVEKYGTGNVKIHITPTIQTILNRCKDGIESTHIIHRIPDRVEKVEGRTDFTAVLPDYITKEFAKARKSSQFFPSDKPARTLPTFHEIRSLGGYLYESQGVPRDVVQSMYAHSKKETTDLYLDRGEIQWKEVDLSAWLGRKI